MYISGFYDKDGRLFFENNFSDEIFSGFAREEGFTVGEVGAVERVAREIVGEVNSRTVVDFLTVYGYAVRFAACGEQQGRSQEEKEFLDEE